MSMSGDEASDLLGVILRRFWRAPHREAAPITGVTTVRRPLVAVKADHPTPPVALVILDDREMVKILCRVESVGHGCLEMPPLAHYVGMLQHLL
jgi:hypothetical protein